MECLQRRIFWSDEPTESSNVTERRTRPWNLIVQRTHPEDRAAVKKTIDRASGDGKDFDHEHRLLMPDGSVKYVHAVARAARRCVWQHRVCWGGDGCYGCKGSGTESCDAARPIWRSPAFESYKQLGLGCAPSRDRVTVGRSMQHIWVRSGKDVVSQQSHAGSYSPRRSAPGFRSGAPGRPRESGLRS